MAQSMKQIAAVASGEGLRPHVIGLSVDGNVYIFNWLRHRWEAIESAGAPSKMEPISGATREVPYK